ncbi:hypothetical protein MKK88_09520 [Methylobacterium sp. E-005]|uniref:hypothetical protein n=1 Tax=Methylobacterium sp. E-005 TaxID=2836549 RepID=UPI001FB9E365|nr:hypothetical protein [Methylobacterium sp. E-005]MCJ2086232.1 hypothetical protein [Methylobacterium sp. E-005]
MLDALARSIAQTAADVLGQRAKSHPSAKISDETVGLYLWHDRGFRDHDTLVQLINATRQVLDARDAAQPPLPNKPVQLRLDLEAA